MFFPPTLFCMAFFKFRDKTGTAEASTADTVPAQSVEELRRRAKYRLVGAAVLVLIGVVGLPLLLDGQPRPIAVNTPIDIPDRDKVLPLVLPAPVAKPAPTAPLANAVPPAPTVSSESVVSKVPEASKELSSTQSQIAPAVSAKAVVASAPQAAVKSPDDSRAKSILEGRSDPSTPAVVAAAPAKPDAAPAAEQRFVVQVGAFADNARAHEVRLKVEKAGLKTYTQVAQTKDGRRVRVRVGPFATKAEAERAVAKIKKLDLPAAVLTL